jgi:hypothetical protein
LASDDPEVAAYAVRQKGFWAAGPQEPRAFLAGFSELAGRPVDLPDVLPADLLQGAQALIVQRGPWEAQPSLLNLRRSGFRALVVSGGWSHVFETVCDVVAEQLGAERCVYDGAGHNVQYAPGFNVALSAFLQR